MNLVRDSMGNDDPPTPGDGHAVLGGDVGRQLREREAEDVAIWAEVKAIKTELPLIEQRLGAKLDVLAAAYQQTLAVRAFACIEAVSGKVFTREASVVYAISVLVVALWATGLPLQWDTMRIGAQDKAANEDSAEGVSGAGVAPVPEP